MSEKSLQALVDKVIGKSGPFRAPAWWVRRLFRRVAADISDASIAAASAASKADGAKRAAEELADYTRSALNRADTAVSKADDASASAANARSFAESNRDTLETFIKHSTPNLKVTYINTVQYRYGNLFGENKWVVIDGPDVGETETTMLSPCYGYFNPTAAYGSNFVELIIPKGVMLESINGRFLRWSNLRKLELPRFIAPPGSSINAFYMCQKLESIDVSGWDMSKATDLHGFFQYCYALKSVDLSTWRIPVVVDINTFFYACGSLTAVDFGSMDFSSVRDTSLMFHVCGSLTTVKGNITGLNTDIDLHYSPLTNDSAMVFINGLAEVTAQRTLTFSATTYATLTPEQIAVATSKGWTVTSA